MTGKSASRKPAPTRRVRVSDQFAECAECDLFVVAKNGMAVAANHARASGHQVRGGQTIDVTYNKKGIAPAYRDYH